MSGLGGYVLPLEFGGEAVAGPAGEGVGLEEAEVADGGFGELAEGAEAVQGEEAPAGGGGGVADPVEGGLPAGGAHGVPAFGEPELGAGVAVVFDEGEVLGTGDGAGGELEGAEIEGVAGALVVEGEGVEVVGVGGVADFDEAGRERRAGSEAEPVERRRHGLGWMRTSGGFGLGGSGGLVGGVEGVGEEGVLDVGGGEFEMLLLVLEAEDDAALGFVLGNAAEETGDGRVDVAAVGEDLVERRTGEGGTKLLLGHVADGAVVGVEEPAEVGVEGLITGDELGEDEGLEEPGGVGEMPLDRRGLGAGLHHHVFGSERAAETHGGCAYEAKAVKQRCGTGVGGGEGGGLSQHGALQFYSMLLALRCFTKGWLLL